MRRHIFKKNKRIRLRRKKIMMKTGFSIGVLLLLFILIVWGSYNERVRISNIYVEGNSVVEEKYIKGKVKAVVAGKYFWIFPMDNIFIYPRQQVKSEILGSFKRIYYAKINVTDLTSVVVTIKERDPYALWCGKEIQSGKGNNITGSCYFIDNKGFVFTKAPAFSPDVYFTVYGGIEGGSREPLGKNFLGEERFVRLMQLRALFLKERIKIIRLVEVGDGDFEMYIDTGGKLIFNEQQDIEKLLRDIVSAIDAKESKGQDIFQSLKYIDLRFNNRVLFKFSP